MGNNIQPEQVVSSGSDNFDTLADASRTDSIVVCTSATFGLSTPFGKEIKKRLGGVDFLNRQNKKPGEYLAIPYGARFVYYLLCASDGTKNSTVENLQNAINGMLIHATENGVTTLTFETVPPRGMQLTPYRTTVNGIVGPSVNWIDSNKM